MKNRLKIHDDWQTPAYLLSYIKEKYFMGEDFFDPCPLNATFDGLIIDWHKNNYINPPYNRADKEAFIMKSYEESSKGKKCVMLLPVSTSSKIFHDIILSNSKIEFLKGRVKFIGVNADGNLVSNKTGQHDSMIVSFE